MSELKVWGFPIFNWNIKNGGVAQLVRATES